MKKNKLFHFSFLSLFLFSLFFSCKEEISTENKQNEACVSPSTTNPNNDSELALLMRKIFSETDSIKQRIKSNKPLDLSIYIQQLKSVHSATPTDSTVHTPEFYTFTNSLIVVSESLNNSSDDESKKEQYNQLVNSCINCHQSFCPGPIKKISKLKLK